MTSNAVDAAPGRLAVLEGAADSWCDGLDPVLLSGTDAADGVVRVSAVIRRLTAAQTGLAVRVAATNSWRGTHPNAALWLAATLGESMGEAHRMLKTGDRLSSCPATKVAFDNGELSLPDAMVVFAPVVAHYFEASFCQGPVRGRVEGSPARVGVAWWMGPGVACPKRRRSGFEPAALE
jgi:hypothetical protein